jgi:protein-disulfide isomerase
VLGKAIAPVTIVEYGDFKCPICTRFFEQTQPQLRRDYIETGKVRLVWRDFPNIDQESPAAAAAAWCAGR